VIQLKALFLVVNSSLIYNHWHDIHVYIGNYIPSPISAPVNRSATDEGSCRDISIMLNNFLIPMFSFGDVSSSPPPNPACCSILIACASLSLDLNNCTSSSTCCNDRKLEIGGTRSSESKASVNPSSVRTGRSEDVAIINKRRPCTDLKIESAQ
jgi:hypothetical protein